MKKASTLKKELTNILKQEEELRKSSRVEEINKNKGLRPAIVASVLRYSNSLKIIESEIIGQHELVLN